MRGLAFWVLWALEMVAGAQPTQSRFDAQRGTCLTPAWVTATAAKYNLDPTARDAQNRRKNPLLQPGMKIPRFTLKDARMDIPNIFGSCMLSGEIIRGLGETVHANGSQAFPGVVNGTVVIERNDWQSHDLSRVVLIILLQEVVGYGVSLFETGGGLHCAQRMSGQGLGRCTPTHINPEVWTSGKLSTLNVYANETAPTTNGYNGVGGLYTLTDNVKEALKGPISTKGNFSKPYSIDFWRDYNTSEQVINYFGYANAVNRSQISKTSACANDFFGCKDGCSKSYACTQAEREGKPCMLVAMMVATYDPGYFQALMANNHIPAYFCFGGYTGMLDYVINVMNSGGSVVFYEFEPDILFYQYPGKFTRIAFPRSDPANVALATGSFGEKGYGNETTNPLSTDYPTIPLMRYMSKVVTTDTFLNSFLTRMQLAPLDINNIFADYVTFSSNSTIADPVFDAACKWVQNNYLTWSNWVDALPLCTMQSNIQYTFNGCNASTRVVTFAWNTPHPSNASLPYDCEGGIVVVPPAYATSKSCDWLSANTKTWMNWMSSPPICDASFYNYTVTDCTSGSIRDVLFYWLLPSPGNYALSSECSGGIALPTNTTIDCDYVPVNSGTFTGMAAFAVIVLVMLVVMSLLVFFFRDKPVIKRSQWHLLLVLLLGGILMCIYVIVGGGAPSDVVCGARPVLASVGYTLAFGSLLLKSLRVYLVFHYKALKKNVVTVTRMLHFLLGFLGIDLGTNYSILMHLMDGLVILGVWFLVDFPGPMSQVEAATAFSGSVTRYSCRSSSFIFPVLCIFWKAIITFIGLYVSFLIRHDDGDFQESIWIFSSACVVLMGSLFMISLAYLVTLPAATTYAFCSVITLVCTITVMGLMLGPKFARLNRADYKSSNTTGGNTKRTVSVTSNKPSSQVSQMPMQSVKSPRDTTTQ